MEKAGGLSRLVQTKECNMPIVVIAFSITYQGVCMLEWKCAEYQVLYGGERIHKGDRFGRLYWHPWEDTVRRTEQLTKCCLTLT